jgi:hypothetical protein
MSNETLGCQRDGAFSTYFVLPEERIYDGKGIDAMSLAAIEPFCIGYHGAKRANLKPGHKVLVVGAGTIGVVTAISAKLMGAEVTICDVAPAKLEMAKERFGIDHILLLESVNECFESALFRENGKKTVYGSHKHSEYEHARNSAYAKACKSFAHANSCFFAFTEEKLAKRSGKEKEKYPGNERKEQEAYRESHKSYKERGSRKNSFFKKRCRSKNSCEHFFLTYAFENKLTYSLTLDDSHFGDRICNRTGYKKCSNNSERKRDKSDNGLAEAANEADKCAEHYEHYKQKC